MYKEHARLDKTLDESEQASVTAHQPGKLKAT